MESDAIMYKATISGSDIRAPKGGDTRHQQTTGVNEDTSAVCMQTYLQ